MNNFNKLFKILNLSKDELWVIIIYGAATALLSLVVPVAAQSLVNIVSFGSVIQPLFILVFIVFVLLASAGLFRIIQMILAENMQQRIFARVSLKSARKLLNIDVRMLDHHQATEAVNRFFDVASIQSASATLLLNGTGVVLQGIFGIILLAFYHPALLVFDIIFLTLLTLVIVIPFRRALNFAVEESNAKYKVANWLEEIARLPMLFRFQKNMDFGFNKTDEIVSEYIIARQKHFRKILHHGLGGYGLHILTSISLLLIGGLLVINNQMTLGQLVAAEIIVSTLSNGVSRLAKNMEDIYDLLTAASKVNVLLTLPSELTDISRLNSAVNAIDYEKPPTIELKNIKVHPGNIEPINIIVETKADLAILGDQGAGKSLLIDSILGFRSPLQGLIYYNGIPLREVSLNKIREHSFLVRGINLFAGTLLENLQLSSPLLDVNLIHNLLFALELDKIIVMLNDGLGTNINELYKIFSTSELQKLMFIRAILARPNLLIVDEALDGLSEKDLMMVIKILKSRDYDWTLIVTTRNKVLADLFTHHLYL